jgi:hypothetical protein
MFKVGEIVICTWLPSDWTEGVKVGEPLPVTRIFDDPESFPYPDTEYAATKEHPKLRGPFIEVGNRHGVHHHPSFFVSAGSLARVLWNKEIQENV